MQITNILLNIHVLHSSFITADCSECKQAEVIEETTIQLVAIQACSELHALLASASSRSYTVLFLVMSSTIGVFLVEREPSRRSSWQANHAVSPEQVFSEIHTMQIFKSLQGTLRYLTLGYTNEVCSS